MSDEAKRRRIPHGTERGARIHRLGGNKPCASCAAAERATARRRAAAQRTPAHTTAVLAGPKKATPPQNRMAWSDFGECRGTDTAEWVPDAAEEVTDWHRGYCDPCPVRAECLQWATQADEYGMWAATTRDERRTERRNARRRVQQPA